jgi:hypothetical protein
MYLLFFLVKIIEWTFESRVEEVSKGDCWWPTPWISPKNRIRSQNAILDPQNMLLLQVTVTNFSSIQVKGN